jgi:glutathione synthase/RimK-type ligase-like ATP-grasp enzyme
MSRMRVALLVPDPSYPEDFAWTYDVEAAILSRAGIEVVPLAWTRVAEVGDFDLVLPLVAWGYNLDYPRWLDLLDRAEAERWPLLNPPALLRWNGDKAYLRELDAKGIPTVSTVDVDTLDRSSLRDAAARLGAVDLVIKPPISGGAHGTYRLGPDDPIPGDVAGQRMMVQAFQPTIAAGEWSIILFDGKFSHAVLKLPAAGEFRVQPHLGGTDRIAVPPQGAVELAQQALAVAPAPALYARVDMITDAAGKLMIMELELIEPALFLHDAPDKGAAFASAVRVAAATAAAERRGSLQISD